MDILTVHQYAKLITFLPKLKIAITLAILFGIFIYLDFVQTNCKKLSWPYINHYFYLIKGIKNLFANLILIKIIPLSCILYQLKLFTQGYLTNILILINLSLHMGI